jgi:hypothetical protein
MEFMTEDDEEKTGAAGLKGDALPNWQKREGLIDNSY